MDAACASCLYALKYAVDDCAGSCSTATILGATFQYVDANSRVNKSGYLFQIFLPDAAGAGVTEAANGCMMRLPSFPNAERPLLDQYAAAIEKVLTAFPIKRLRFVKDDDSFWEAIDAARM